jgi:hypothetical protein
MNAKTLPIVDPMMVRSFSPTGPMGIWGGVLVMTEYDVVEIGLADVRRDFDEARVDCSNRIFQITTEMMVRDEPELAWTAMPSRRWRNFRTGGVIHGETGADVPGKAHPLLYVGNPIRLLKSPSGIDVIGRGEFIIKSGVELGY